MQQVVLVAKVWNLNAEKWNNTQTQCTKNIFNRVNPTDYYF